MLRFAIVRGSSITAKAIEAYLPANYSVMDMRVSMESNEAVVVIAGVDRQGWGLDTYVIPRLASGLWWATELVEKSNG